MHCSTTIHRRQERGSKVKIFWARFIRAQKFPSWPINKQNWPEYLPLNRLLILGFLYRGGGGMGGCPPVPTQIPPRKKIFHFHAVFGDFCPLPQIFSRLSPLSAKKLWKTQDMSMVNQFALTCTKCFYFHSTLITKNFGQFKFRTSVCAKFQQLIIAVMTLITGRGYKKSTSHMRKHF